ncbi:hypothetical protein AYI68_g2829 [Smittium mucronatum]|uniref:Uncharacterized protein n=1 Tax=Smittium mucronatum TaxID=133383 RepID=A0A1R0H1N8_9FUNG|nr:hypothetical protein AYI68_g2829 [Smittium mucronatum]
MNFKSVLLLAVKPLFFLLTGASSSSSDSDSDILCKEGALNKEWRFKSAHGLFLEEVIDDFENEIDDGLVLKSPFALEKWFYQSRIQKYEDAEKILKEEIELVDNLFYSYMNALRFIKTEFFNKGMLDSIAIVNTFLSPKVLVPVARTITDLTDHVKIVYNHPAELHDIYRDWKIFYLVNVHSLAKGVFERIRSILGDEKYNKKMGSEEISYISTEINKLYNSVLKHHDEYKKMKNRDIDLAKAFPGIVAPNLLLQV